MLRSLSSRRSRRTPPSPSLNLRGPVAPTNPALGMFQAITGQTATLAPAAPAAPAAQPKPWTARFRWPKLNVQRPVKAPPVDRNWAWFLGLVLEAQEDRALPCHPSRAMGNIFAVHRNRKRWAMMGNRRPPSLLSTLVNPVAAYKESCIRVYGVERSDFVEPWIPTGLIESWDSKAAWADQPQKWRGNASISAFKDPNAIIWIELEAGQKIEDVLWRKDFYELENDEYRMDDIVNVERRSTDNDLYAAGLLEGEVDLPEPEPVNPLLLLAPHIVGLGIAMSGVFIMLNMFGG